MAFIFKHISVFKFKINLFNRMLMTIKYTMTKLYELFQWSVSMRIHGIVKQLTLQ